MVDAGAGAIVLPSMLQEQITYDLLKTTHSTDAISMSGYQPQHDRYNGGTQNYLKTIRNLKTLCQVPIIGSLNGSSTGPWLEYAIKMQDAGVDALELNWQRRLSDPNESCQAVETQLIELVCELSEHLAIPLAVKLTQQFTNLASIAHKLHAVGVAGLVLFAHRPHWDVSIDRMHWTTSWQLSPANSLGTILEGIVHVRTGGLGLSLAASGGVRTAEDAIKAMIVGADIVMVTSEIYRQGPDAIHKIMLGLSHYLDTSHHESLMAFQQSRPTVERTPEGLVRLDYVDPLTQAEQFIDPTPHVSTSIGDAYGHPVEPQS